MPLLANPIVADVVVVAAAAQLGTDARMNNPITLDLAKAFVSDLEEANESRKGWSANAHVSWGIAGEGNAIIDTVMGVGTGVAVAVAEVEVEVVVAVSLRSSTRRRSFFSLPLFIHRSRMSGCP